MEFPDDAANIKAFEAAKEKQGRFQGVRLFGDSEIGADEIRLPLKRGPLNPSLSSTLCVTST